MSAMNEPDGVVEEYGVSRRNPMSKTVDWVVSSFLVLVGSAFAIGGVLLSRLADVDQVTAWVASGPDHVHGDD